MSYPPKVKRNALHDELGIPHGQKIGEKRLEAAKAEGEREHNPTLVKRAQFALNFNDHGHHGHVVAIRAHHSRANYMTLEVAHGKRSKRKDEKGNTMTSEYDDRPTSSLVIPKSQAKHFRIGQKVGVGAVPLEGPDTDEMTDSDDGDDDGDIDTIKRSAARGLQAARSTRFGGY